MVEIYASAPQEKKSFRPPMTRKEVEAEISSRIITVPNNPAGLPKIIEARKDIMKHIPRVPSQRKWAAYLCLNEIDTPADGIAAKHDNNSSSRYGIDGARIQLANGLEGKMYKKGIPPGGTTSWPTHTHQYGLDGEPMYEHYLKRSGSAYISDGKKRKLMEDYEVVPPDTKHFIESPDGAEFDILIENVRGIPENMIHHYDKTLGELTVNNRLPIVL